MSEQLTVLIIDDEENMRDLVQMYLENSGFHCIQAEGGDQAYAILDKTKINIILLDIMMPGDDGYQVCEKIRKRSPIPIIFLSAKGEEWDKVKALQLGGDDYIVKPFSPGELIARMNAVLRRSGYTKNDYDAKAYGAITVDKKARRVTVEGEVIPLTLKEYELLLCFINNQGQALSREQLLQKVWGLEYEGSLRTVDTHVKTLRMKLGTSDCIQTVWGIGYKFEVQE